MIMHLSMFLSSGTRLLMTGELRRSARMLTPTSSVTVMFQLGFKIDAGRNVSVTLPRRRTI